MCKMILKKFILILLVLGGFARLGEAQTIVEEPLISSMMRSYVDYNKNHTEMRGWRIQLVATTDKRQMESAKRKFYSTYPEYELINNHVPPFFHLKTGAFLKKQNALPFLKKMKKSYPGAFLVADELEVHELLRYN